MRNINLFVEDVAHEDFLTALIQRLAHEYNVEINIKAQCAGWAWNSHYGIQYLAI